MNPVARLLAGLITLSLAGCGDPTSQGAGAGEGGASGASGAAGKGEGGAGSGCGGQTVARVRGRAALSIDAGGDAGSLGAVVAQACMDRASGGLCLAPRPVGEDGGYDQQIAPGVGCVERLVMRVASSEPGRASVYCEAEHEGGGVFRAGDAVLPGVKAAEVLPPEGDPAAEREVRFSGGLSVRVVPGRWSPDHGEYGDLRGGAVSPEGLCFVGKKPIDRLFAFWPEGDVEGGFAFRVANELGLAPGTRVAFSVLGGLFCAFDDGRVIPEGAWAELGGGQVDEKGAMVVPDGGVELPGVGWFGYAVVK